MWAMASGRPASSSGSGRSALDRPARLGEALPAERVGLVQVAPPLLGAPAGPPGGLQLGDDAGEALRQRVVDLAGDALPLVEDAGLTGLGEQLGVQPGVLLESGLEPREQLPALPVLLHQL
jgi:hypothetical protein